MPITPTVAVSTPEYIADIAYDPDGNKVYVAYWDNDIVDILNRDLSFYGTIDLEFDTWGSLTSIDIHKGVLYGSMQNQLYVRSADLLTKQTSAVFGPFSGYGNSDIIVEDDLIYIVNYVQNAVVVYNFLGEEIKRFTTEGLRYPQDAAWDYQGFLHVVGTYNNLVYKFDRDGSVVSTYGEGLFIEPFGIFIDSLDNSYVADRRGQNILAFGEANIFVEEFLAFPWAVDEVVVLPDCTMLVSAGSNNTLLAYDG